jgi:hypothetical protein
LRNVLWHIRTFFLIGSEFDAGDLGVCRGAAGSCPRRIHAPTTPTEIVID